MIRILFHASLLGIFCILMSCKEKSSVDPTFPRDPQMARIQILNAFSATDAALKSAAYHNPLIEVYDSDRGSSGSGINLEEMRAWTVELDPNASKEDRVETLAFIKSLENSYTYLGGMDYSAYSDFPDFNFSFVTTVTENQIEVMAKASYGREKD